MKTVATVVDTNISALIGPTKNIKRIYTNRKLFESEGIALAGPYFPGGEELDGDAYRQSRSFKFKSLIKGILRSGTSTSWLLYQLTHMRNANQALDKYFADTGDNVDLVVFRDITSASEYLNRGGKSPFVLVLHCDEQMTCSLASQRFRSLRERNIRRSSMRHLRMFAIMPPDCYFFLQKLSPSSVTGMVCRAAQLAIITRV